MTVGSMSRSAYFQAGGRTVSRFARWAGRSLQLGRQALARGTSLILGAVLLVALSVFVVAAGSYSAKKQDNELIDALLNGRDLQIDPLSANENVLQARGYFHLYRDDVEAAQPLIDAARTRASPVVRAAMLYNMANARLRRAIELGGKGNLDKAAALVRLAKDEYRESLSINPDDWNAKYNLDLAMKIVRDFPSAANEDEEADEDAPKKIWTDLPGVPRGLP